MGERDVELPEKIEIVIIKSISPNTEWRAALKNVDVVIQLAARVYIMNETSKRLLNKYELVNTNGKYN